MPTGSETEIALLKQAMTYTNEKLDSIERKIDAFIESADKKFVTEIELAPIRDKQKSHDEIISRIAWAIFWGFVALI